MIDQIIGYIVSLPIIIISLTIHEFSHAWVAYQLGDPTAKDEGRLTLNPIAHIDPIGFLFMVFARIGWAKPVPVDTNNFRNPMLGQLLVAAAGPASNFVLALIGILLLKLADVFFTFIPFGFYFIPLYTFIMVNVSLGIFNLIPVPPFDGGNIVGSLLPEKWRETWDSIRSIMPIILLLMIIPGSPFFTIFNRFWYNILDIISATILRMLGI